MSTDNLTPVVKKRLFPAQSSSAASRYSKNNSPAKFTFLKFMVDQRTHFVIVQSHNLSIITRKYFRYNRWSNSMNTYLSSMEEVGEFRDLMKQYRLFEVGSDRKLLSSFTILAATDLECKKIVQFNF